MNGQQIVECKPEFTLKRQIVLLAVTPESGERLLSALNGVDSVERASLIGACLQIRYDASQLQLDQLLALLEQQGCRYRQGLLDRARLAWYRMIDRNTWDGARHVPHCCNKSPR